MRWSRKALRYGPPVRWLRLWSGLWLVVGLSSTALAAEVQLTVRAAGQEPMMLTLQDLASLASQEVQVVDESGKPARYRGVVVAEVMARAGARLPKLRGQTMIQSLLVKAADGYAVVFALAELDADFTSEPVLLCFEKDGAPLDAQDGPLRLVVPKDKRHARWVRKVTELVVQTGDSHED